MHTQLALDRASVRRSDVDGRLHVALSNMSKATVNPYRGAEIPGYEDLGLDAERIYMLLRDPEELSKAAPTFNNLPILSKHVPVSAREHMPDLVIGSTGTDADFAEPYLQNSAVIWVDEFIQKIEADEQKEWSCAYRYVADMSPGTYKGLRYDGIMRNIIGNHVALVPEGRAGPDVVVGDGKLEMPKMALKTRKAIMVRGALTAYLAPKLAADAAIDLTPMLANVTAKNYGSQKAGIVTALTAATVGKLAQDADLEDVVALLDTLEKVTDGDLDEDKIEAAVEVDPDDENKAAVDADGDDKCAKLMAWLEGKLTDEQLAEAAALVDGEADTDPEPAQDKDDDKMSKTAMDAALAANSKAIVTRMNALAQAREDVEPVVGKVSLATDSASKVYKLALDHMGVDLTGVSPVAYRALFTSLHGAATKAAQTPRVTHVAMDAATKTAFPNATRLKHA